MNDHFHTIVSLLQAELQEYGGLLHLFDRQQAFILHHNPEGFLELNIEVDEQIEKISHCRRDREAKVSEMASQLGKPAESTLSALVTLFPAALQPLIRALIEEINNLIARTQRRTRQNRMLLSQCVESARQLVATVDPGAVSCTYSPYGKVDRRLNRGTFTATLA